MTLTKTEWHKKYRELLISEGGMTRQQAFDYLVQNKAFFDYGYTPEWYVKEEMACLDNYAEFKIIHTLGGKVVKVEKEDKKTS